MDLLMQREECNVEALVVWIGLFDITLVPLAHMRGVVTDRLEDLGDRHFVGRQPLADQRHLDLVDTGTRRMASSKRGGPRRRTRRFGVHMHQRQPFGGKLVDVGRLDTGHVIEPAATHLPETDVVYQHLENVGRLPTVRLAYLGQVLVDARVLFGPLLTELGLEKAVLAIADDGCFLRDGRQCQHADHQ